MEYLLEKGGIIIYPLLLSSVVSLTVILERFYHFLRTPKFIKDSMMRKIKNRMQTGDVKQAASICEKNGGPVGKVLKRGILNLNKDPENVMKLMEEVKWEEFPKLEKRLGLLNFIGKISPTLGLLGTVTGMIKTFHVLSMNGQAQQLAGGISEALITTAVGLIISIPTLGAYHYFTAKIQSMVNHTEKRIMEIINFNIMRETDTGLIENEV